MKNLIAKWLLGINKEQLVQVLVDNLELKAKIETLESKEDEKYILRSDFDPDDYDFDPLRDYDFSEFLTSESMGDVLVDNEVVQSGDLDHALDGYATTEYVDGEITSLKNRLNALEEKAKPKRKKPLTDAEQMVKDHIERIRGKKKDK
jgi:hypothetical protein